YIYSHAHGGRRYELCRQIAHIQVSEGGTALATDQVLDLMRKSRTYYERGNAVVVVADNGEVSPVGPNALKQRLEREIAFTKWDARKNNWKRIDCPDDIVKRILEMRYERQLPVLSRVIQCPTMTP